MRFKPGPGWEPLSGVVWKHFPTGMRLHTSGLLDLNDGRLLHPNSWPESVKANRCIRICGGNRRRGLMVWALEVVGYEP